MSQLRFLTVYTIIAVRLVQSVLSGIDRHKHTQKYCEPKQSHRGYIRWIWLVGYPNRYTMVNTVDHMLGS